MKKTPTTQTAYTQMNSNNIEAYTPKYAVDVIVPYLERLQKKKGKQLIIWAPFSREEHNFVSYLRTLGFNVINTHYNPETGIGDNFLTFEPDFEFDLILDNPPFKNKTSFVERAMSFNKPFALLLPLRTMEDKGTPKLFMDKKKQVELLIPDDRMEFHNQPNNGISFKCVYICENVLPRKGQTIIAPMKKVKLITGEE